MKAKLLLLLILQVSLSLTSFGETETINKIKYSTNTTEKSAAVVGFDFMSKPSGELTIPSTITVGGESYTVTELGNNALCFCNTLTGVTIPNTVTSIGSSAFGNCTELANLTIPSSVASIGDRAFSGCTKLTAIMVDAENTDYSAVDGVLFNKDITKLIYYPTGKADASYTIPNSVEIVAENAFYNCIGVESISIPKSVTTLENFAFYRCEKLSTFSVEWETPLDFDLSGIFYSDLGFMLIVPAGSVDAYKADKVWSNAFAYIISASDKIIGDVTIDNITYKIINNSAYVHSSDKTGDCVIPSTISYNDTDYSVVEISFNGFNGCRELTSVTIPNTVTVIGGGAFHDCGGLKSVTIPNTVTSIGDEAFSSCRELTTLVIPSPVKTIGDYAFSGCSNLTSIEIPSTVTDMGDYMFSGCSALSAIEIDADNDCYSSVDGVMFNKDLTKLICYPNGKTNTEYKIPSTVNTVADCAFYFCDNLTSIEIPSSVSEIELGAFKSADNIVNVKVNWETPVKISSSAFGSWFVNVYEKATLTVPVGTVDAYKADEVWGTFSTIIEEGELSVEDNMADSVKLYVTADGQLIIKGATAGAPISIYNIKGVNVASAIAEDGVANIAMPDANGAYLVTVGSKCYKVIR